MKSHRRKASSKSVKNSNALSILLAIAQIIPLKRIFHRRIAAPEFSRGFMVFENLVLPLCAFASLRLCENESSNSGGGSRKGAKTQRSQREDPSYGWTKFSKTINPL